MDKEKEHIIALQKGSYEAFTILYKLYLPRLYAFIFDLVRSRSMAEEIVQETFIRLWETHDKLDMELSFKSYLFTIARNRLLNELRKRINNSDFCEYLDYSDKISLSENTTEQSLDFDDFCRELARAKTKLTPRQAEIFDLQKEQGLSVKETAEKIGISEQGVRNQLSAALKILRNEMKDFSALFIFLFL